MLSTKAGIGLWGRTGKSPLGVLVKVLPSPTSSASEVPFHLIDPESEKRLKSGDGAQDHAFPRA